jgi:uncharacterized protein (TIGR02246 family)
MRHATGILAVLLGAIGIAALASAQPKADLKAQIEKANAAFVAAFAKGDAAAIAQMYSSDAQVLPPNSEIVSGTEAIQSLWKGAVDMGAKAITLKATETEQHGPAIAHEVGTYTMTGADGKEIDRGKYVVIWKREGNAWKIHRDIWNTSLPAAR